MKLKRAMRYYRLWIYTCNAVLVISVLAFISAAVTILADPRRHLSPAFSLSQPSFIYAYIALFLQGTVVPIIGCLGANRLNPRWLQVYWIALLFLLGGDILLGIVWIFRFQRVMADLLPQVKENLSFRYGRDQEFSRAWDELQMISHCCGADGPADFNESVWFETIADDGWLVPESCCSHHQKLSGPQRRKDEVHPGRSETWGTGKQYKEFGHQYRANQVQHPHPNLPLHPANTARRTTLQPNDSHKHPSQHNKKSDSLSDSSVTTKARYETRHVSAAQQDLPTSFGHYTNATQKRLSTRSGRQASKKNRTGHTSSFRSTSDTEKSSVLYLATTQTVSPRTTSTSTGSLTHRLQRSVSETLSMSNQSNTLANDSIKKTCWQSSYSSSDIQPLGCGKDVVHWVEQSADILFVLGFCVLSFVKLCFLAILYYELREMLQKIKVLRGEIIHQFPELTAAIAISSLASPLQPTFPPNTPLGFVPSTEVRTATYPAISPVNGSVVQAEEEVVDGGEVEMAVTDKSSPNPSFSKLLAGHVMPPSVFNRLHHQLPDGGADSDTGSHCGLLPDNVVLKNVPKEKLVRDWDRNKEKHHEMNRSFSSREKGWQTFNGRPKGNNNEYHELLEIPVQGRQTEI